MRCVERFGSRMAVVMVTVAVAGMQASPPGVRAGDALVDLLVFGSHVKVDAGAYAGEVRVGLERYLRRASAYRPRRADVEGDGLWKMVQEARDNYARRLAAVSDDPRAAVLAEAYVEELRPCYEWEGYHGCPESEARFAERYQAAHPDGPFRAYLPLLAAHRWLCAAEAYEYEKQPADAARSRLAYEHAISLARQSPAVLIRTAAGALAERGRCFARR